MRYEELCWPRVQLLDKNTPVIIPLGSLEQHGHHLPLMTDSLQVDAIAKAAESRLSSSVLLLPALWLGNSEHHIDFPGTISVGGEVYAHVIRSIARCLLHAGFTKQLFLNGHGGNFTPASEALGNFCNEDDDADAAYILLANWWGLCRDEIAPARMDFPQPGVNHACAYETSLMRHIHPELVDFPRAMDRPPTLDSPWTRSGKVTWFARFARRTSAGATGYPTLATAEKGETIFQAAVTSLVAFLNDFQNWPNLPRIGPQ